MTCAIEHTLFLGASVRNFSTNLGYNQQQSTLSVTVVEDDKVADEETPKVEYRCGFREEKTEADYFILQDVPGEGIGRPAFFKFGALEFGGLVQNWEKSEDVTGKPIYNIQLVDPRELLAGTVVITGGYSGTTQGIPNIFNVFAHMEGYGADCEHTESGGFGGAMVNEAGMPWNKIKQGLEEIVAPGFSSDFGAPISFRGHTYFLDISELPVVEDYVRVSGNQHSILDLIDFICTNTNHDYYIELFFDTPTSGDCADVNKYIKVQVVPRQIAPLLGRISQFIDQETAAGRNVVSNTSGYELRTEPTVGFMVGGNQEEVFEVFQNAAYNGEVIQEGEEYKYNIWPYWGEDVNGNLIIGRGKGDKHYINVDITDLPIDLNTMLYGSDIFITGGRYYYRLSVREMRYILVSEDAWFTFLQSFKPNTLLNMESCSIIDVVKLSGQLGVELNDPSKLAVVSPVDIITTVAEKFRERSNAKLQTGAESKPYLYNSQTIYRYLLEYISKYYGKQFMVGLPELCSYKETETDHIIHNVEPIDSGWIPYDESRIGLNENYHIFYREEDGKTRGFVKYRVNKDVALDPERSNEVFVDTEEAIIFKNITHDTDVVTEVYVPLTTNPEIKFVFRANVGTSSPAFPKVIIQVDGQTTTNGGYTDAFMAGTTEVLMKEVAKDLGDENGINDDNPLFGAVITAARNILDGATKKLNLGDLEVGKANKPEMPIAVALPLRSLVDTYGPWVSSAGPDGPVNFEQNDQLVPWNYGSQANLDEVAQILVDGGLSYTQVLESGQITFAGVPQVNLGRALLSQGPIVSNMSVTVGAQGLTTTYQMRTYTPKYGVLSKANADRFRRLSDKNNRAVQKFTSKIREKTGPSVLQGRGKSAHGGDFSKEELMFGIERRRAGLASKSPIGVLYASTDTYETKWLKNIDSDTTNIYGRHQVYMSSYSEFISTLSTEDWQRKAFVSLDGIFTPYSVNQTQEYGGSKDSTKLASMYYNSYETGSEFVLGTPPVTPPFEKNTFTQFARDITSIHYRLSQGFNPSSGVWRTNGSVATANNIGIGMRGDGSETTEIAGRYTSNSIERSIALRGPVMICGWGFDTNNRPIPNSQEDSFTGEALTDKFLDRFLERPYTWKCGPLDVRWDSRRGVWTSWPGYSKLMVSAFFDEEQQEISGGAAYFKVDKDSAYFGADAQHHLADGLLFEDEDRKILAYNPFNFFIEKDDIVMVEFDLWSMEYIIVMAPFRSLDVVTGVNFGAQTTTKQRVYVAGYDDV